MRQPTVTFVDTVTPCAGSRSTMVRGRMGWTKVHNRRHPNNDSARLAIVTLLLAMLLGALTVWALSFSMQVSESVNYSILFQCTVVTIELIGAVTFLMPGFPIWEAIWLALTICLVLLLQVSGRTDKEVYTFALLSVDMIAFSVVFPFRKNVDVSLTVLPKFCVTSV